MNYLQIYTISNALPNGASDSIVICKICSECALMIYKFAWNR